MKNKHLKTALQILLVLLPVSILYSCNDDSETWYEDYGIVNKYDGNNFRIILDNNEVLYPRESYVSGSSLKDSARLYVRFNILEETDSCYYIRLTNYRNILTKQILPYEESILDSIGNDPAKIYNHWLTHGFLNFEFMYAGSDYQIQQNPHMVNLLQHPAENSTLKLEFRHNAFNDRKDRIYSGVVSFPIESLVKDLTKPVKIEVTFHDSANTSQTFELTYQ